jgi:hypothetical protein
MQKLLWFIIPLLVAPAVTTVRRPLYSDPNTGFAREMNQLLDAPSAPTFFIENANVAADQNVFVGRDQNGNMTFTDKVLTASTLTRLVDVFQMVNASQSANVTATTTYTTIVSQSITTRGGTRVFVIAMATCSNASDPGTNDFQLVQGSTQFGNRGASSWDGPTIGGSSGVPSSVTLVAVSSTLTAGTYTFSMQASAATGTVQCRPGTVPEGSTIYLFELNF